MQLAFDFGDEPEPDWSPLYDTATPTEAELSTGKSILPASFLNRRLCRDCGKAGTTNQGGGGGGGGFLICDDCAHLDGCIERAAEPGRHCSWWGYSHAEADHAGFVASREKRRNAWRRRAARSINEGESN